MTPGRTMPAILSAVVPGGATPAGRAWLVTFTDMVCLMLAFFVMLFAMSEPEPRTFQALAAGLSGSAPPRQDGAEPPLAAFTAEGLENDGPIDLGYLGRVIEAQSRRYPELAQVVVTRRQDDLVLALPSDLLFAPGSAALSPAGEQALFVLGGVARNIGNAVEVVGHTDPTSITRDYPSNWELSLDRARSVAAGLRRAGYLRDITVRGQADGRFAEVAPWRPEVDRMRLARRVDVVVRGYGDGR